MFAYGFLSVVLALYLSELGFSDTVIGVLLSLTLIGDAVISLIMTTTADRFGRRRILILGASLMLFAGTLFAFTTSLPLLLIAAIVGVISPSGYEVGPFLAVEQAALSQTLTDRKRTSVFAWYNLVGSFATAFGALTGGGLSGILQNAGTTSLNSYRAVVLAYAAMGVLLALMFMRLSPVVEAPMPNSAPLKTRFGLHRSRGIGTQTVFLIWFGRFCRRFRNSEYCGLLVSRSFRRRSGNIGRNLLWGQHSCWNLRSRGCTGCRADRACEYDGLHASPFQYPSTSRSANAQLALGDRCFLAAI